MDHLEWGLIVKIIDAFNIKKIPVVIISTSLMLQQVQIMFKKV